MSTTAPDPAQTPSVQDQPAATPQPVAEASGGQGPWARDLEAVFSDPATRGQVDQFLREKVQPHTTQLEQRVAQSDDAMNLWTNLQENPYDTYVAMTSQMFGEEAADQVLQALTGALGPEAQQAAESAVVEAAPPSPPPQVPPHDARMQNMLDAFERQEAEKVYETDLEATVLSNPDLDPELLRENIHAFVAAADGDFVQAAGMYRAFTQRFGAPTTAQEVAEAAPPTVGGEGSASGGTPTIPAKQSWDDAFSEFGQEIRASNAPPPVGPA